jgi:hypothetical protein
MAVLIPPKFSTSGIELQPGAPAAGLFHANVVSWSLSFTLLYAG